ncbi:MAG: CoA ester lyase [Proteobacteria bacterium]|nr:CoA ester lyase [Pseudomonadota bacterium]
MSFTSYEPATPRLQRSELAVPASSPEMFEKAAKSDADYIFLDCEDAVVPDDKEQARKNVIEALNDIDWSGKTISVRINGLDTHYMYRDVVDIIEQAGKNLDTILIPKVGTAQDVYAVDMLVTQVEDAMGLKKRIGFECLIETALGGANVMSIATASKRLEAFHFGVADYSASMHSRTTNIGGLNPDYVCEGALNDQWHAAQVNMLTACRAFGLRAIDGPFGDFSDDDAYRAAARRVAALGYDGKWAIHPRQIPLANEVMSPPDEDVARARRVLEALAEAAKKGSGAAQLDGKMIDIASEKMALNLISQADQIAAKAK